MTQNTQVPILGTTRDPVTARLKVSASTREEAQIASGDFFVGRSLRTGVTVQPASTTYYSLFEAGANYVIVEDVFQTLDFSSVTDGRFQHVMEGFVFGSNINSWSYTPVSPSPAGRNLNTAFINKSPTASVDLGGSATLTGVADYALFDTTFYIDTGGNRNTLAESGDDFFSKGRQIVIPPGGQILIRAISSGDATGSADIKTTFFFSEVTPELFPTVFGAIAP